MERDAAGRALSALRLGTPLDSEDYRALRAQMRAYLGGAWPSLSDEDAFDTVDEVLARLSARPSVLPGSDASGWLGYVMRMVRNLQIDRFRARRDVPAQIVVEEVESAVDDVEILALIDRSATLASVQAALAATVSSGDQTTFKVVTAWLNAADIDEAAPSNRAVAETLGIVHSTVGDCLTRFRETLRRLADEQT